MNSAIAGDHQATAMSAYLMHGVHIAIESNQLRLLDRLQRRLASFPSGDGQVTEAELRFEFRNTEHIAGTPGVPDPYRPVYEVAGTEFRYDETNDLVFVRRGARVVGVCNAKRGHVRFELQAEVDGDLDLYSETCFTVCLVELLKRHGRFSLHGAGITVGDAGMLIVGPSGAGKSTVAVVLLHRLGERGGFLGDDMLFVRTEPGGLRILGWPELIDLGEWTQRSLPGLASRMQVAATAERKGRIAISQLGASVQSVDAHPEVIVFPRVTRRTRSIVVPLSKDEALVELAPNVLLTEAMSSQAHLAALASLTHRCRCYRLEFGNDIDRLPDLLLGLI